MNQTSNDFIQSYERIAVLCFVILVISIGNTMVSRGIWDKYQFWNITRGIYPKFPVETIVLFVYTTRLRNFRFF